ncbi:MAG: alpha/beta hydrolase [Candidatus Pacearchaeota archaeon]|jgi:hypothetical protein
MKKRRFKKRKVVLAFLVFSVFLAMIIFGAKIYLFINLFLGNDVLITITTDNENFFLSHGESQDIKIKTDILTNPFCSIYCDYSFIDISSGHILDNANFSLKIIAPVTKNYTLVPPSKGIGQKLYRFDIECKSERTFLCHTTEELKKRNLLITLNYDLNLEEKEANQEYRKQILELVEKEALISSFLADYKLPLDQLNESVSMDNLILEYDSLKASASSLNQSINNLTVFLNNQEYAELSSKIPELDNSFLGFKNNLSYFNKTVFNLISGYNSASLKLVALQSDLKNFQYINVSNETLTVIDKAILDFNNLSVKKTSLIEKELEIALISISLSSINLTTNLSNLTETFISNESINQISRTKIDFPNFSYYSPDPPVLMEKVQTCCLFNQCHECCNDSCYSDKTKFPVIFIHGHDFSKIVSAEYNLNIFDEMQRALENEGYLDAGSMLIGPEEENLSGILGKINYPVTVKASYYFDSYQSRDQNIILQTKQDNLDTYAIRLNDIVNSVKFKTNREKVIIISHSMGGLVFRRYLQIFGEGDISKAILIASPNHGVNGTVLKYCSVFGAELECEDMDPANLFLNKLDNAKNPKIPIYNIIGIGCDTDGETGDKVVTNNSAYLSYAKNYFINGTCEGSNFQYLHTLMVSPSKTPEVYKIIKEILKEN